jgi:hypothetical protein
MERREKSLQIYYIDEKYSTNELNNPVPYTLTNRSTLTKDPNLHHKN